MSEMTAKRRPPSRQSIPHNFHDFLGVKYAAVRRVEVAELAARLQDEPEPEPGAGVAVPPWAVVSKGVGGGWHGTGHAHRCSACRLDAIRNSNTVARHSPCPPWSCAVP